jgi:chromosome segregation ATPase
MEEKFYKEVNDSLKDVFDITSRIDERIKVLVENHNEAKEKIEKLCDQQIIMLNRLTILENKNGTKAMHDLKNDFDALEIKVTDISERLLHVEKDMAQTTGRWASIIDFVFKVGVMVIGAIILWKLGIKP